MQKILDDFKSNCAIKSILADWIWKGGLVLFSVLFVVGAFASNDSVYKILLLLYIILLYIIVMIILYLLCDIILFMKALKCMGEKLDFKQSWSEISNKIDQYQKDWITKYCKKN